MYAWSGRIGEGISWLQQALTAYESAGIGLFHSLSVVQLGEAYLLADQVEDARACADRAVRLTRERGNAAMRPGLSASWATLPRIRPSRRGDGRSALRRRQALASELGMRPLAAHCHRGLGTLYAKIGRRAQAHAELSTAIELYRAMAMTFWLPKAEAALVQVAF